MTAPTPTPGAGTTDLDRGHPETQEKVPRPCRQAQRWQGKDEATISRLTRKYGPRRSQYRGHDQVMTGVGLGSFAHNGRSYSRGAPG